MQELSSARVNKLLESPSQPKGHKAKQLQHQASLAATGVEPGQVARMRKLFEDGLAACGRGPPERGGETDAERAMRRVERLQEQLQFARNAFAGSVAIMTAILSANSRFVEAQEPLARCIESQPVTDFFHVPPKPAAELPKPASVWKDAAVPIVCRRCHSVKHTTAECRAIKDALSGEDIVPAAKAAKAAAAAPDKAAAEGPNTRKKGKQGKAS